MSAMRSEISEQPDVLRRLLQEAWPEVERAAEAIRARGARHVLIAARGSSDNAARYGQYLLGAMNGLLVGLATPSLFTVYDSPPRLDDTLVVGLSQSGRSPDVAEVVERARAQGALALAITNDPESPLAKSAAHTIWIRAGEERSIPATKTYSAQLMALAMLGTALKGDPSEGVRGELQMTPGIAAAALGLEGSLRSVASGLRASDRIIVIGRGYNFSTAFEVALKLQETAYVMALPFSSADFKHGPLSIVDAGLPVLILAPPGRIQAELLSLARDMRDWGARVLLLADDAALRDWDPGSGIALPATPEWLSPFPAAVAGQLLACLLAQAKGLDPDKPRRLQKVTRTF